MHFPCIRSFLPFAWGHGKGTALHELRFLAGESLVPAGSQRKILFTFSPFKHNGVFVLTVNKGGVVKDIECSFTLSGGGD